MKATALPQRSAAALLVLVLASILSTGHAVAQDQSAETSRCKFTSDLPDDCLGAKETKFENLRNYRFCEVDLFGEDKAKDVLYNNSYNTTGQNGGDQTRNSCPQALFDKLDPEAIKKEYKAVLVFLNPPRYWTMDWATDYVGRLRDFDGLKAPWMGNNEVPKGMDFGKLSSRAYHYIPVARTSAEGIQ